MANAVRTFMKDENSMLAVIDVAGGHGALGALFLALSPKCKTAVVIDPAEVRGKDGVQKAWGQFWQSDSANERSLRYRHECLRTGLRDELNCMLSKQKNCRQSREKFFTTSISDQHSGCGLPCLSTLD